MSPLNRACDALEAVERQVAYSMELIRLVDGDRTYRLSIGGQTYDFTDSETDDWNAQERLYDKLRQIKRPMAARAVLLAVRELDEGMLRVGSDAGGFDGYRQEQNTPAIWQAMIDYLVSTGEPS